MANGVAHAAVAFERLYHQGRSNVANATALAAFAARQFRAGRLVGAKLNVDDVTSPYAHKQRGFRVQSLDRRNPAGDWKEIMVEDRQCTPAELAASRIDLDNWFADMPGTKRRVAQILATGESGKETARLCNVTPGRVSQLRRELESDWADFHGVPLAVA
jgi:hypothetical protein